MEEPAFSAASQRRDGRVWVVRVTGELDLATSPRFQATLDEVLASDPATVLLGLEGVTFLDSTGIRAIVAARKQLKARGATLVLDGLSGAVQQVLEVSGLLDDLTQQV
ncbi:MAG TPA: STAS domain-containing protein [Acidimicrobiia bacterium]|nr:STAS domain-containing protein [Acidimicrobiia bacterium]